MAVAAGVAYHEPAARAAALLLDPPTAVLLARAGRCGLSDPELARIAAAVARLAIEACAALGDGFLTPADRALAVEYFDRYTFQGRSPADEA